MPVDAPLFPVNLVVEGRRVLVVGGGRIAARKAAALLACRADVHVVATEVGDEMRALDGVTIEERPYAAGDVAGYRLVITATGDRAVDQQVHDDCEAAGIWVNSADDPDRCTFTLPAVVRREPLMVTVSTGGHSPALASWLRRRLDAELGPEYLVLLQVLADERREQQAAGRSTEDLDWNSALESGMLDLIRAGQVREARERLKACLSSS